VGGPGGVPHRRLFPLTAAKMLGLRTRVWFHFAPARMPPPKACGPRRRAVDSRNVGQLYEAVDPNEQLNPSTIREWADVLPAPPLPEPAVRLTALLGVRLERSFPRSAYRHWRVLPTEIGNQIYRIEPASAPPAARKRPRASVSLPPA
jgi:hypothetical protein